MSNYTKVEQRVQEYLNSENFEQAEKVLYEELQHAYVPLAYYEKWTSWLKQIQHYQQIKKAKQQQKKFIEQLNENDLIAYTVKKQHIDFAFLDNYAQKYPNFEKHTKIAYFQLLLNNKNFTHEERFQLLQFLILHSKHHFFFENQVTHFQRQIDHDFIKSFNENLLLFQKYSQKLCKKDVSVEKIVNQLYHTVAFYYFPQFVDAYLKSSLFDVAKKICSYVTANFWNQKIKENEYSWLINALKENKH